MKPIDTVDLHIRWAWNKISRLYNAEAQRHKSTMAIGFILLNIDRDGTPSTQLGPKMGVEPRSLTRILNTMEEDGLIYREKNSGDRRVTLVYLTSLGKEKREIPKNAVLTFNSFVRKKIGAEKYEMLIEIMQELNDEIDQTESNLIFNNNFYNNV